MITDYKYIYFIKVEDRPKTSVWECWSKRNGGLLGEVSWYGAWQQYVYTATTSAVYSMGCLDDISSFIRQFAKGKE